MSLTTPNKRQRACRDAVRERSRPAIPPSRNARHTVTSTSSRDTDDMETCDTATVSEMDRSLSDLKSMKAESNTGRSQEIDGRSQHEEVATPSSSVQQMFIQSPTSSSASNVTFNGQQAIFIPMPGMSGAGTSGLQMVSTMSHGNNNNGQSQQQPQQQQFITLAGNHPTSMISIQLPVLDPTTGQTVMQTLQMPVVQQQPQAYIISGAQASVGTNVVSSIATHQQTAPIQLISSGGQPVSIQSSVVSDQSSSPQQQQQQSQIITIPMSNSNGNNNIIQFQQQQQPQSQQQQQNQMHQYFVPLQQLQQPGSQLMIVSSGSQPHVVASNEAHFTTASDQIQMAQCHTVQAQSSTPVVVSSTRSSGSSYARQQQQQQPQFLQLVNAAPSGSSITVVQSPLKNSKNAGGNNAQAPHQLSPQQGTGTITMLPNGQCVIIQPGQQTATNLKSEVTRVSQSSTGSTSTSRRRTTRSAISNHSNNNNINNKKKRPASPPFTASQSGSKTIKVGDMYMRQDPHDPAKWHLVSEAEANPEDDLDQAMEDDNSNLSHDDAASLEELLHEPGSARNNNNNNNVRAQQQQPATNQPMITNSRQLILQVVGTARDGLITMNQDANRWLQSAPLILRAADLRMANGNHQFSEDTKKRIPCSCPNCKANQSLPPSEKFKYHICHHHGCNKTYGKTSHLRAHLRGHDGMKPYVCDWAQCSKAFTRSDELQRHMRTHMGVKKYLCHICDKRFIRGDHLQKHMRTHSGMPTRRGGSSITVTDITLGMDE